MEAQLSLLADEAAGAGDAEEVAISPAPESERETIIRRADDEDTWALWTNDPGVAGAIRRIAGRPGVTVREEGEAVRATFPAKALKVRGLARAGKPCGVTPPPSALSLTERETVFQRSRGACAWEVATTSPRVQEALLAFVNGKAVTVRRSERRREELIFTLPAAAVRIVAVQPDGDGKAAATFCRKE